MLTVTPFSYALQVIVPKELGVAFWTMYPPVGLRAVICALLALLIVTLDTSTMGRAIGM